MIETNKSKQSEFVGIIVEVFVEIIIGLLIGMCKFQLLHFGKFRCRQNLKVESRLRNYFEVKNKRF